jgi:catalase
MDDRKRQEEGVWVRAPEEIDENSKQRQLQPFTEVSEGQHLTTNQGVKVHQTDDSLKAGGRGPTLMEDFHFREKLTHFDHERIPERVVHARGAGAHGYFQVYESMAEYSRAAFLQDPSKKTPVFVRFSTVVGSRGSADTVRDARGFATKFFTEEGNYDLVANNIPVFFIQDAIKFPDLVHSIKPEPHNEIPQATAAHDTFWDFVANQPETTHMIMWLMSDRAVPKSFRMMQGFGVNTFRFVNAQGKARFVKFHWKPKLGLHQLVWDEAQKIGGVDPDFHRRDLWNAIERGDYPEYELGVQLLDEEDEFKFDFDILDATKIWPEEDVPVRPVGKMVLDRNPENFFAETEQVAFHPGNVVPGIDFSNDPLLQGRLFSYLDTQLIRLGGPNFHEIPINRPLAPVHTNQRDGYHRMTVNRGRTSYSINSLEKGFPRTASPEEGGYVHYQEKVEGRKIRERSESFKEFYSQATLFWNSMTEPEKEHIVDAFLFEIGKVNNIELRKRLVDQFNNVDGALALQMAEGLGVAPPDGPGGSGMTRSSPALSFTSFPAPDIKGRRVAFLAADGFVNFDLDTVMSWLHSQGALPEIVSSRGGIIKSVTGDEMSVGKTFLTSRSVLFDAVYVPGGKQSVEVLKMSGEAIHFINEAFRHAKPIAASGEGVELLRASSMKGIEYADPASEGQVRSDKGVITVGGGKDLQGFLEQFGEAIKRHRDWTRQNRKQVPA